MTTATDETLTFPGLGLSEPILAGVADAGYDTPTEIQARVIPIAVEGRDLIGLGETGSGKTAAYGLPMLERLLRGERGLRGLILVPTRELCVQVAENLRVYARHSGLSVCTAFGGIPITIQEAAFRRGLDVLVACPGRLIDHFTCGTIDLGRVETLVVDEADRMLDMGFMPQIRRILGRLPRTRQNCLYSATMPPEVDRLVKDHFGDPTLIQVGQRSQAPTTILHEFVEVQAAQKQAFLESLLRKRRDRILLFVKTKVRAEEIGRRLQRAGLPADSIHGDKSAESRHVVLKAFARGKTPFLVATDVAARGIDVTDIELVVNADMPRAVEDYVHRVGRTGRAGSEGHALSLITRLDKGLVRSIVRHLEKTSDSKARVIIDGEEVIAPDGRPDRPEGPERGRSRPDGDRFRRDAGDRDGPDGSAPRTRGRGRGREDRGRGDGERERGDRERGDRERGDRGRNRADQRPCDGDDARRQLAALSDVSLSKRPAKRPDDAGDVLW